MARNVSPGGARSSWGPVALLLVLLLAAFPAQGNAVVAHVDTEGALAIWSGLDESGCIIGVTAVGAADFRAYGPYGAPTTDSYVGAQAIRADVCAGRLLMLAQGSAFIEPDAFAVAGDIQSAVLDTVVPMRDLMSGRHLDLAVQMDVQGGDEVLRIASTDMTFFSPGELSRERTEERVRPGTATGSAVAGEMDFTAIPFVHAEVYEGGLKRVGTPGSAAAMADAVLAAPMGHDAAEVARAAAQGVSAHATWIRGEECLQQEVRLVGSEVQRRGESTRWFGMARVSVLDLCEGRFVSYAATSIPLERGAFTMHGTVNTASLQQTFHAHDWAAGSARTMEVDVAWVRDGDVVRDIQFYDVHMRGEDDVFVMHNKDFASEADAYAEGSVLLDGVEQLSGPSDFGSLWSVRSIQA